MSKLELIKTAIDRRQLMRESAKLLREKYPELLEKERDLQEIVKLLEIL